VLKSNKLAVFNFSLNFDYILNTKSETAQRELLKFHQNISKEFANLSKTFSPESLPFPITDSFEFRHGIFSGILPIKSSPASAHSKRDIQARDTSPVPFPRGKTKENFLNKIFIFT
jgi:hypothetical protein